MSDHDKPISQEAAREMLAALREIANFPHAPANRDLTFSEALFRISGRALAALAKAEGR